MEKCFITKSGFK